MAAKRRKANQNYLAEKCTSPLLLDEFSAAAACADRAELSEFLYLPKGFEVTAGPRGGGCIRSISKPSGVLSQFNLFYHSSGTICDLYH
jgi:hypothetical protein